MVAATYHSRQMLIKYVTSAIGVDEDTQAILWNLMIPWEGIKVSGKKLCEELVGGMDDVMGKTVRAKIRPENRREKLPGTLTPKDKTGASNIK